ncbi:MAG: 50S ribosomal protein L13 [Patescibacteria group bacterium]
MNNEISKEEKKTIDASGRSFGRVATEVADALRGKDSPFFEKNRIMGAEVNVVNVSSARVSAPKKHEKKVYVSYSGYPGGKKERTLGEMIERRGHKEVMRRAVYGMLPNNKLRPRLMKRLNISE